MAAEIRDRNSPIRAEKLYAKNTGANKFPNCVPLFVIHGALRSREIGILQRRVGFEQILHVGRNILIFRQTVQIGVSGHAPVECKGARRVVNQKLSMRELQQFAFSAHLGGTEQIVDIGVIRNSQSFQSHQCASKERWARWSAARLGSGEKLSVQSHARQSKPVRELGAHAHRRGCSHIPGRWDTPKLVARCAADRRRPLA